MNLIQSLIQTAYLRHGVLVMTVSSAAAAIVGVEALVLPGAWSGPALPLLLLAAAIGRGAVMIRRPRRNSA